MKPRLDSSVTKSPQLVSNLSVFLARLTWFLFGPAALLLATVGIINSGTGWLTGLDAFFALILSLMLLGRWVEHRSGTALTARGDIATDEHFRRYMITLPAGAAGLWIVANVLGNHVLK